MTQQALIDDLRNRTHKLIASANEMKGLGEAVLNQRPSENAWSPLECLEHLNLYGDFYLPEIERALQRSRRVAPHKSFKSGWFGERTVASMLPKDQGMVKMKAFKSKTPDPSALSLLTVDRFLKQQQSMADLLDQAVTADLQGTLTKITLPVIRFYLGTTLRFVIYHNERHMWQATRALEAVR